MKVTLFPCLPKLAHLHLLTMKNSVHLSTLHKSRVHTLFKSCSCFFSITSSLISSLGTTFICFPFSLSVPQQIIFKLNNSWTIPPLFCVSGYAWHVHACPEERETQFLLFYFFASKVIKSVCNDLHTSDHLAIFKVYLIE